MGAALIAAQLLTRAFSVTGRDERV
jgi:hypothetical protein